jgi:hypothetical protein
VNSSAEQYFNTAMDCCRRNDMSSYLVRAMKSLIYWYEEQGRAAQAEVAWTQGHELMQHLSLPPIRLLSSLIPECEHA